TSPIYQTYWSSIMRRSVLFVLIVLSGSIVRADCRVAAPLAFNGELKIVVPFALPVGVPVAPFAPYFYSYQQYQGQRRGMWDEGREKTTMPPREPSEMQTPSLAPRLSTLSQRCATCHGGPTPEAGLSLEHPDQLTADTRLAAIRAIAT